VSDSDTGASLIAVFEIIQVSPKKRKETLAVAILTTPHEEEKDKCKYKFVASNGAFRLFTIQLRPDAHLFLTEGMYVPARSRRT